MEQNAPKNNKEVLKWTLIILLVISIFGIFIYCYGVIKHKEGVSEGIVQVQISGINNKIVSDTAKENSLQRQNAALEAKYSLKDKQSKKELLNHQALYNSSQKQIVEQQATINKLSDSLANSKIDKLEKQGKSKEVLTDYVIAPILQAENDSLKKDCETYKNEVSERDTLIAGQKHENILCDSTKKDLNDKIYLLTKSLPKKQPVLAFFKNCGLTVMGVLSTVGGYEIWKGVK